jgi:hypothetical protein
MVGSVSLNRLGARAQSQDARAPVPEGLAKPGCDIASVSLSASQLSTDPLLAASTTSRLAADLAAPDTFAALGPSTTLTFQNGASGYAGTVDAPARTWERPFNCWSTTIGPTDRRNLPRR